MTIIFRSYPPEINDFLQGKLSDEVLSKYWFKLGKNINSGTGNQNKYPIRDSMFKNSNYLDIWKQLTAHYDKVRLSNHENKISNLYIRIIFWCLMAICLLRILFQFYRVLRSSSRFHLSTEITTSHIMVS